MCDMHARNGKDRETPTCASIRDLERKENALFCLLPKSVGEPASCPISVGRELVATGECAS